MKHLPSNSDFINKIKERSNTAALQLNPIIGVGTLFNTNYDGYFNKDKEFQITLTIPDFSRETNNVKYQLRGLIFSEISITDYLLLQ